MGKPEKSLKLILLMLLVKKWTGRATFSLDHLDLKSSVDKEVYKDGKICLLDTKELNKFEAIKKRMEASCAAYGYRMQNGPWVIPFAHWPELEKELEQHKVAFDAALADFLLKYPSLTADWIASHPKDASFIQHATPGASVIEERFQVDWTPQQCSFDNPAFAKYQQSFEKGLSYDLASDVSDVAGKVLAKLAQAKRSIIGLADLQLLRKKVGEFAFLRPEFQGVGKHLDQIITAISAIKIDKDTGIPVAEEAQLRGLLMVLKDPIDVLSFGQTKIDAKVSPGQFVQGSPSNSAPTQAPSDSASSQGSTAVQRSSNTRSAGRAMF